MNTAYVIENNIVYKVVKPHVHVMYEYAAYLNLYKYLLEDLAYFICLDLEETEDSEYFAENLAIRYYYRIHGIILRLETDMSIFFVEGLYCG